MTRFTHRSLQPTWSRLIACLHTVRQPYLHMTGGRMSAGVIADRQQLQTRCVCVFSSYWESGSWRTSERNGRGTIWTNAPQTWAEWLYCKQSFTFNSPDYSQPPAHKHKKAHQAQSLPVSRTVTRTRPWNGSSDDEMLVWGNRSEQLATPVGSQGSGTGCDIWLLGRGRRMKAGRRRER